MIEEDVDPLKLQRMAQDLLRELRRVGGGTAAIFMKEGDDTAPLAAIILTVDPTVARGLERFNAMRVKNFETEVDIKDGAFSIVDSKLKAN